MRSLPDAHLARLLYARIVNGTDLQLAAVARRAGMSPAKLYSLCEGHRHVLAVDLPGLYRGTDDIALYAELAGADLCGLVVTAAAAPAEACTESRRSAALCVAGGAGRVAELVDRAEADGRVTEQERAEIARELDRLERQAERLRQLLVVRPAGSSR